MEFLYKFDFVHDTQKVFRKILSSISQPGKIYNISEESNKFDNRYSSLLAIGTSLLDNEVSMFVEKTPSLEKELEDLTLVRKTNIKEADFIFITAPMNYECTKNIIVNAKTGDFKDPHKSATIVILCDEIIGDKDITLKGPGINIERKLSVTDYIKTIININQENRDEYPCGIDIIFVSEKGEVISIPRLCKII